MASEKQRRKQAKQAKERRTGGRQGPHPDGDRRRRGGLTADEALRQKRERQRFPGALPTD